MADQQAESHGCRTGCEVPEEATDLDMKEAHGENKDEGNPTLGELLSHSVNNSSSVRPTYILSYENHGFPIYSLHVLQASDEEEAEQDRKKSKAEGPVLDDEEKAATGHEECIKEPEEKKQFPENIKEKLPGHEKKVEGDSSPERECPAEKKGILEKIKEKLPGCHKHGEEKDKHI